RLGAPPLRAERSAAGQLLHLDDGPPVEADAVLVAVGRAPNVEGLGLEAAGVRVGRHGVEGDDRLRTSNRRVYAPGDVCGGYQVTRAAAAMARIVLGTALF